MRGEAWQIRHEIEGRPLLGAVLGLIVGLTAVSHPFNLAALAICWWAREGRFRIAAAVGVLIGTMLAPKPAQLIAGRGVFKGEAQVIAAPRASRYGQTSEVEADGKRFLLSSPATPPLALGQSLALRGLEIPLDEDQSSMALVGVAGRIVAAPGEIRVTSNGGELQEFALSARESYRSSIARQLPPDAASVAEGAVFGSDDMSPEQRTEFRASGAIAVTTAAGLQVYLLAYLASAALRMAPISRTAQLALIGAGLAVFAVAGGLHPGAIRACVVLLVGSAAFVFRREPDVLSALALAAILELIATPVRVYDLGFQISFLIVTTVVLYVPGISTYDLAKGGPWPVVRRTVGFFLIAALASAPMLAYQTGRFELSNPLASLLIVPAIPFIVASGLLVWILSAVSFALSTIVSAVVLGPLCGWSLAVVETLGARPMIQADAPGFSAYWLVPYYVLLILGARISSKALRGSVG